jgi:plastocyanin
VLRASILSGFVVICLLTATDALAHGPEVHLSYGRVSPAKVTIRVGQTVHFHNDSTTPRTFTVVADGGAFESPPLTRGEGWHHEFSEPGRYPYSISEFSDMIGLVLVAPAEP